MNYCSKSISKSILRYDEQLGEIFNALYLLFYIPKLCALKSLLIEPGFFARHHSSYAFTGSLPAEKVMLIPRIL